MSIAYNKNVNGARNGGIYENYSGGPSNNVEFDFRTVEMREKKADMIFDGIKMLNTKKKTKAMTVKYFEKLKKQKKEKKKY